MQVSDVINALELSAAAYRNIQPVFPGGSITVIDDAASGVQCYLRKKNGCLSITFRGSNSGQDWKTNFAFHKKVVPYGNLGSKIRIHNGFLQAYKSPAVRNTIHRVISGDICQVKISGHSQGAALAILCAVDLQYNYPDLDYEAVLFGAPRVGNRAFQRSYDQRVFKTLRIENGNDIVTKVPPVWMGYRHVGICIHIGTPKIPGFLSFKSHYPQSYYKYLFGLLSE